MSSAVIGVPSEKRALGLRVKVTDLRSGARTISSAISPYSAKGSSRLGTARVSNT